MFFKKEILGSENFYTKYITNLLAECSFKAESNKDIISNMCLIESHIIKIEPDILKLMIIHAESHEQKLKHVQLISILFLFITGMFSFMYTLTIDNPTYNFAIIPVCIIIFILLYFLVKTLNNDRRNLFYTVLFKEVAKECLIKSEDKRISKGLFPSEPNNWADGQLASNEINDLIKDLDEDSIQELRKYTDYLKVRQTLDKGSNESSAGNR